MIYLYYRSRFRVRVPKGVFTTLTEEHMPVYCACIYPSKLEDLSPELQKEWMHLKGCCVRCMCKIRSKEDWWLQQRIDAYKE